LKTLRRLLFLATAIALMAAGCEQKRSNTLPENYTADDLIEANKRKIGQETTVISDFVERNGWDMKKTATGIRYDIYAHGTGDSARADMVAAVSYRAFLLDSTYVAGTPKGEVQEFRIGEANVVAGLHEAVTLLHVGDSARIVIPSYLAFGLTGNQINIPPNAALFYDITLVDLY